MRILATRSSVAVVLGACVTWPIVAECQLSFGSSTRPDDSPREYSYNREIDLGPYKGDLSGRGVAHDCSSSHARLEGLLQKAGRPEGNLDGGLNDVGVRKRKDLIDAYANFVGCDQEAKGLGELLDTTFVPWVLSSRDILVDLATDRIARVNPDSHQSDVFTLLPPRTLTPAESSQPHQNVTIGGGFVLGTLFAEDPAPKYEEGKPVYDISESDGEVKFVRKFKSLMPGTLSKPVNFTLTLSANPSDSLVMRDGTARTIIKRGDVELVEWDMSPHLKRHWFHDDVSDVTIRGTIAQTSDDGHEIPGMSHDVEFPNNHFKIRRQSWMGVAGDQFTSFFKSIPGWISLLEAAVLAWIGFFRKVRSKPDVSTEAHPTVS